MSGMSSGRRKWLYLLVSKTKTQVIIPGMYSGGRGDMHCVGSMYEFQIIVSDVSTDRR